MADTKRMKEDNLDKERIKKNCLYFAGTVFATTTLGFLLYKIGAQDGAYKCLEEVYTKCEFARDAVREIDPVFYDILN